MNYEYKIQRILEANTAKYYMNKLGYSFKDLEPHIGRKTMKFHYDVHYRNFTKGLNEALGNRPKPNITALLKSIKNYDAKVNHNAGGYYNHKLFWEVMNPNSENVMSDGLKLAIDEAFGSFDNFKDSFSKTAATCFGSGWAWLCVHSNGDLEVCSTANQDNPLMPGIGCGGAPILGLDVWEHAYYLNYQNRRPDYVDAFFNVINWDAVAKLYSQ